MSRRCAVLLGLLALPVLARGQPAEPQERVLDNGLRVVCQHDAAAAFTVVHLLVRGGGASDPAGKEGLAYLTARLALEVPEEGRLRHLLQLGCTYHLQTAADYSTVTLRVNTPDLEPALAILARSIARPLFSDLRIDSIKGQMATAEKLGDDDLESRMRRLQATAAFGSAGYGRAAFGTQASRRAIRRPDVQACHRHSFHGGNLVLLAVSDLAADELHERLARHFARLPAAPDGPPPAAAGPSAPAPEAGAERLAGESLLARSARLPALDAHAYFTATLLESWLGRGVGSRLWTLRDRLHLTYDVEASLQPLRTAALLHLSLKTGGDPGAAATALDERLAEIRAQGIDEAGVAAARAYALAEFWRRVESRERRVALWSLLEGIGLSWRLTNEWEARLNAVGAAEANAMLRAGLDPSTLLSLRIGTAE